VSSSSSARGLGIGRAYNDPVLSLAAALSSFGDDPLTRIRLELFIGMMGEQEEAREAFLSRLEGVDEALWPAVVRAVKMT
jgi:hypothetical protein